MLLIFRTLKKPSNSSISSTERLHLVKLILCWYLVFQLAVDIPDAQIKLIYHSLEIAEVILVYC